MAASTSTMKSFMNALEQYKNDTTTSGIAILDRAVRAVSGFNSLQDAVNNFVKDVAVPYIDPKSQTKAEQDAAKKAANERLKTFCGIELGPDNKFDVDTGAVSGKNAGNGTLKDAQSIVPEKDGTGAMSSPPKFRSVSRLTVFPTDQLSSEQYSAKRRKSSRLSIRISALFSSGAASAKTDVSGRMMPQSRKAAIRDAIVFFTVIDVLPRYLLIRPAVNSRGSAGPSVSRKISCSTRQARSDPR